MGTCYSSHSHTGKRTYPSDMSINSDRSSRVPLPRPAYTGHSNKMPEKPGDRAALTQRSQSATRLPLPRSEASPSNRFGYKKSGLPTAKSSVMRSTDSIDSAASDVSRTSTGSQRRSLGPSYAPRESKAWKMIDDSSTMDSRSTSMKSKSTRSGESKNTTPVRSANLNGDRRSLGVNRPSSGRVSTGISVTNNKPVSSPVSDTWVKAAPIDSVESLKENRNQINTKKKFGFFGRSKSVASQSSQKSLGENSKSKRKVEREHSLGDDSSTPTQGSVDNLNQTYIVEEESNKSSEDPVNESYVIAEKEETVQTSVILIETGVNRLQKVPESKAERGLSFEMEKSVETVKDVKGETATETPSGQSGGSEACSASKSKVLHKIPLARMDSIDSGSMSSINSDDLMLDMDLNFDDEMSASVSSAMERSLTRPRALSDAESNSLSRQERRPNPTRPRLSDSVSIPTRRHLLERQASDRQLRLRGHSITTGEAVHELGSLISDRGVQRRNPRLEQSTRPASFPGPLGSGGEDLAVGMVPRPFTLKPPRQPSVIEDEEAIAVDGYTYRHMQQDMTMFKTMLLKLKRVIQEDELGSPMDPNYKNGIKYSYGSSAGTPDSPIVKTDESWKTAFMPPITSGPRITEVEQENSELRQQLQAMEKKLEDQQKTIKLLQQQMTKYECGHMGPGGCVYSNAATQTDKPRLGATARGGARGSSRVPGATASSSENVISSSTSKELRNSSENIAKNSVEKRRSLLQPSVLVKDKDSAAVSPRRSFGRTKDAKTTTTGKPPAHVRPKSSTQLPSYSSTVPLVRKSGTTSVSASRASLDSQKSSSDSRLSTDSGRRSLTDSQKKKISDRRCSNDTKSSTDTGIAEISPAITPETPPEQVANETPGGNDALRPPVGNLQLQGKPVSTSRLSGSRLARPYGAARGSRLASLLNKNTSGIPARTAQQ